MLVVGVEHVGEDIFGVLEPLYHFEVGGLHGAAEGVGAPFALFVHVGDHFGLGTQHDLCVILEINLDHLVRKSEHNSMSSSHPLLHINNFFHPPLLRKVLLIVIILLNLRRERLQLSLPRDSRLIALILFTSLQITSEMLQQSDFLLKLLRVLSQSVFLSNILSITTSSLHIVKVMAIWVQYNFSGVIEEDTSGIIRQIIP